MSTKFFNNMPDNSLFEKFKGIAHNMLDFHTFQAVVGYFRSSGYFKLRAEFEQVKKIQILVGINIDNIFRKQSKLFMGHIDEEEIRKAYSKDFVEEVKNAGYDEITEKGILQFCQDIMDGKLEIRIHRSKNLHAKFYLLLPENHNPNSDGWVIMGSSNLSDSGMGTTQTDRYELNVAMKDYDDVDYCKHEFEQLWQDAIPLEMEDIQKMKAQTHLAQLPTPYELYMKVLIDSFGTQVEDDFTMEMPDGVKDIRYQHDAVIQGYQMLMQHNGFFLADVVGLGKTIVATMIAKRFIEANGRYTNILVVYPPAVEKNWKDTFKLFGIKRYAQFVSNGSLSKIIHGEGNFREKGEYDIVIVDEAHNYRGETAARYDDLQLICKTPRVNEGLVKGRQKKVMLLSATPLNNRPTDLLNLLLLFQNARYSTIEGIQNLPVTFSPWIEEYDKLMRERKADNDGRKNEEFAQRTDRLYEEIRTQVIDKVTVRRTRSNIKNVPAYKKDLDDQHIVFPDIEAPKDLTYLLDGNLNDLFYNTMDILTDTPNAESNPEGKGLHYARYRAVEFLQGEAREKYPRGLHISTMLTGIYRVHMVKRLESSFHAFRRSLHTFLRITEDMIKMFEQAKVIIAPDINVKDMQAKGWELDRIIEYAVEKKGLSQDDIQFDTNDFNEHFLQMLEEDKEKLESLCAQWDAVDVDPKLELFIDRLQHELFDKDINPTGKLVIFSESVDTVNYLTEQLKERLHRKDILDVCAENRDRRHDIIRKCFDANSEEQSDEYNIIITSDVLAEGVNLHRANVIINFDSPWNATRLMQRIGRVNRIGSVAEKIYNYMFYPSAQGNKEIHLYSNALIKIQGFHSAFGEDAQIYSKEEIVKEFQMFNPDIMDVVDRNLKFLEEVRALYRTNRKLYNRIKALPMKSRTVRKVDACQVKKNDLLHSTIVYLSSPQKIEYYWVHDDGRAESIPFLDAMDIMNAKMDEQPEPFEEVMDYHYEQVKNAVQSYKSHVIAVVDTDSIANMKKDKSTNDVLSILRMMQRTLGADEVHNGQSIEQCQKLQKIVEQGVFTGLRSSINSFGRAIKKKQLSSSEVIEQTIEKLAELYERYNIPIESEEEQSEEMIEPQIVVSETFI